MPHGGPDRCPAHKSPIQCHIIHGDDIIYRVIEQGDETRDTYDRQGLSAEDTEDHGCESGGEEGFIDAVEIVGSAGHVECVG